MLSCEAQLQAALRQPYSAPRATQCEPPPCTCVVLGREGRTTRLRAHRTGPTTRRRAPRSAPATIGRMVALPSTAVPPLPIARFSVEQYHRMVESGAFTE